MLMRTGPRVPALLILCLIVLACGVVQKKVVERQPASVTVILVPIGRAQSQKPRSTQTATPADVIEPTASPEAVTSPESIRAEVDAAQPLTTPPGPLLPITTTVA